MGSADERWALIPDSDATFYAGAGVQTRPGGFVDRSFVPEWAVRLRSAYFGGPSAESFLRAAQGDYELRQALLTVLDLTGAQPGEVLSGEASAGLAYRLEALYRARELETASRRAVEEHGPEVRVAVVPGRDPIVVSPDGELPPGWALTVKTDTGLYRVAGVEVRDLGSGFCAVPSWASRLRAALVGGARLSRALARCAEDEDLRAAVLSVLDLADGVAEIDGASLVADLVAAHEARLTADA